MNLPPALENFIQNDSLANQLCRLVDISLALNSTLDPAQVLRSIIETATQVLDCEVASIMLYDEKRGELIFEASSTPDAEKLTQIPVPLEGSIAGTIFCQNQSLIISDVSKDPRHYARVGELTQFQPRSLVGVPMRIRERVTGVLEALNKRQGEFNETDAYILSVIASQSAVAIHNARLMQSLQTAYDELSRLDRLKSEFIAIASHELRTPLGVILGYATFLKEETEGASSEHAKAVLNSALRMQVLVEEMTNMNLLQLGSLSLDMQPVDIQAVLRGAFEEVRTTAEAKNQRVTLQIPDHPLMVRADRGKLISAFVSLLNNAVRFTPPAGEIILRVTAAASEVRVAVADTGTGIPAGELENIFKEFYQVEHHMTRRHGGLGLGLAIVRGIVELHGGRVWAESAGEGKGATFQVALPTPK